MDLRAKTCCFTGHRNLSSDSGLAESEISW